MHSIAPSPTLSSGNVNTGAGADIPGTGMMDSSDAAARGAAGSDGAIAAASISAAGGMVKPVSSTALALGIDGLGSSVGASIGPLSTCGASTGGAGIGASLAEYAAAGADDADAFDTVGALRGAGMSDTGTDFTLSRNGSPSKRFTAIGGRCVRRASRSGEPAVRLIT